jgi:hypothetical protein
LFYPEKGRLLAEKDVIFEDGKTVRRLMKVEIERRVGSVLVDEPNGPLSMQVTRIGRFFQVLKVHNCR